MSSVHVYDGFSKLEEIWLGDIYPNHFLNHLPTYVQDSLGQIFEWTREDLNIIQKKLQEFGVTVRRPIYQDNVSLYCHSNGVLFKPEICPRDKFLSFANTIVIHDWLHNVLDKNYAWRYLLDEYRSTGSTIIHNPSRLQVIGANAVRLGQDLFLDTAWDPDLSDDDKYQEFHHHIPNIFSQTKCHFLNQGGHCDAGFAVLGPGRLLTTEYYDSYANCFQNWELLNISSPEFRYHRPIGFPNGGNGRWWVPDCSPGPNFNDYLIEFANDWIGNYRETYFECNCLVIDEKNIMCIGTNDYIFKKLHEWGFNVHVMPFRTRGFWDGGLHCITLDIRRVNGPVNYFDNLYT
jgi:hypothetical protein